MILQQTAVNNSKQQQKNSKQTKPNQTKKSSPIASSTQGDLGRPAKLEALARLGRSKQQLSLASPMPCSRAQDWPGSKERAAAPMHPCGLGCCTCHARHRTIFVAGCLQLQPIQTGAQQGRRRQEQCQGSPSNCPSWAPACISELPIGGRQSRGAAWAQSRTAVALPTE